MVNNQGRQQPTLARTNILQTLEVMSNCKLHKILEGT